MICLKSNYEKKEGAVFGLLTESGVQVLLWESYIRQQFPGNNITSFNLFLNCFTKEVNLLLKKGKLRHR